MSTPSKQDIGRMKLTKDLLLAYVRRHVAGVLRTRLEEVRAKKAKEILRFDEECARLAKPIVEKESRKKGSPKVEAFVNTEYGAEARVEVSSYYEVFDVKLPKELVKALAVGTTELDISGNVLPVRVFHKSRRIELESRALSGIRKRLADLRRQEAALRERSHSLSKTSHLVVAEMILDQSVKRGKLDKDVESILGRVLSGE